MPSWPCPPIRRPHGLGHLTGNANDCWLLINCNVFVWSGRRIRMNNLKENHLKCIRILIMFFFYWFLISQVGWEVFRMASEQHLVGRLRQKLIINNWDIGVRVTWRLFIFMNVKLLMPKLKFLAANFVCLLIVFSSVIDVGRRNYVEHFFDFFLK